MSLNLTQATQFKIKDLTLITKLGSVNITGIYQEINIYDSMFMPCVRGDILIQDAIGLSNKLLLDGSEYISMEITKGEESGFKSNATTFKRTFRIYKQSGRENVNQNSELYVLYFASDELIYSEQQKINQSFTGAYSDIVNVVLKNYLSVSSKKINKISTTKGVHTVIVPSLSPFDTMDWLSKKAIDSESLPNFLFFENKYGYNFVSLSELIQNPPIMDINFEPKNFATSSDKEFYGAREAKIVSSTDLIENIKNGVYAGKFIGIDPLTRKVSINRIDFQQTYGKTDSHLNKYPNFTGAVNKEGLDSAQMFDSKVSLYAFSSFRGSTPWVKKNDPRTGTIIDDTHAYVFQRAPIFANLLQTTIHLNIPGNFGITSGAIINLIMPVKSTKPDAGEAIDETLSGKYIVTAARQVIKGDMHETVIEVATDSTNRPFFKRLTGELLTASSLA
jgi:hypothetical protein